MAAADGMLPEMRQRRSRAGKVASKIRCHVQCPSANRGCIGKHPQCAGRVKTRGRQAFVTISEAV